MIVMSTSLSFLLLLLNCKKVYLTLHTSTCQQHHQLALLRSEGGKFLFVGEGWRRWAYNLILKGRKELVNQQSLWSPVLFAREERLRLECESRMSVSKWEDREC